MLIGCCIVKLEVDKHRRDSSKSTHALALYSLRCLHSPKSSVTSVRLLRAAARGVRSGADATCTPSSHRTIAHANTQMSEVETSHAVAESEHQDASQAGKC